MLSLSKLSLLCMEDEKMEHVPEMTGMIVALSHSKTLILFETVGNYSSRLIIKI